MAAVSVVLDFMGTNLNADRMMRRTYDVLQIGWVMSSNILARGTDLLELNNREICTTMTR